MTDREYRHLLDLAKKQSRRKVTREEALQSLIQAGILDESGNFTPPYENLGKAVKELNRE